jgi:hypothetical protein
VHAAGWSGVDQPQNVGGEAEDVADDAEHELHPLLQQYLVEAEQEAVRATDQTRTPYIWPVNLVVAPNPAPSCRSPAACCAPPGEIGSAEAGADGPEYSCQFPSLAGRCDHPTIGPARCPSPYGESLASIPRDPV